VATDNQTNKIWIYWHQGIENAPGLVKDCVDTWQILNPKSDIIILSGASISDYISVDHIHRKVLKHRLGIAAYSDLLRIELLHKYGGIWIDATVLCLRPLDQWLDLTSKDFFAFSSPGPDRMISSWFLAAASDSIIVDYWYHATRAYWQRWHPRRPYYWFHYLFNKLYKSHTSFGSEWDKAQKISADGPHHMAPFRQKFFETATSQRIKALKQVDPPVLKLTYKCLEGPYPSGSMIRYIMDTYGPIRP
jgi:Mannosyltransferase OCH1 and related enzymes